MWQNVLKTDLPTLSITGSSVSSEVSDVTRCEELAYQLNVTNANSLSGVTVKIQKSLDRTLWHDDISAENITGNGEKFLAASSPLNGNFYKLLFTKSGGSFTVAMKVLGKGPTT